MKKKQLTVLIFSILLIAILIIFIITRKKDYSINYKLDNYEIIETYDDKLNFYYFELIDGKNMYDTGITSNRVGSKLIKSIEIIEDEKTGEKCILANSKKLNLVPVCYKNGKRVDYSFIDSKSESFYEQRGIQKINKSYKNIQIDRLNERKILVWAHNGYYRISDSTLSGNSKVDIDLTIFEKETYYNSLAYKVGNYVITPNYDDDYTFDTFYITNFVNGVTEKWNIEENINFNSYYLGSIDGKVYLFDRKDKCEYKIDPKKKKIEKVSKDGMGLVYLDEWKEISTNKLANSDYTFEKKKNYEYTILEDGLYMKYTDGKSSILISKQNISKIIEQKDDSVFYLVGETLYEYNPLYGEIKLMTYSEWNFNNINSIFIY